MTRKFLFFIFTITALYGCGNADFNDADKRNENWIYWVDKKTGKASWILAGDETTVKDGRYTSFYKTGEIYQKGKLKKGKEIDTIYFYDLKEKLIKYKLIKPDTLVFYYVKDGDLSVIIIPTYKTSSVFKIFGPINFTIFKISCPFVSNRVIFYFSCFKNITVLKV